MEGLGRKLEKTAGQDSRCWGHGRLKDLFLSYWEQFHFRHNLSLKNKDMKNKVSYNALKSSSYLYFAFVIF